MASRPKRTMAETLAALPGVVAAVYAAVAYDRGWNPDGLLVRAFAAICGAQASVLGGKYSAKLSIVILALPLAVLPALAVKRWQQKRAPRVGG